MRWCVPEETRQIKFSPNGQLLATTGAYRGDSDQETLRLWDTFNGHELAHLDGLDRVWSLSFASERELVVVEEHRCLLWNAASGEAPSLWCDTNDPAWQEAGRFTSGTVSREGKFLALCVGDVILVVQFPAGPVSHRLKLPKDTTVWYDHLMTDGTHLAAVCEADRNAYTCAALWDAARGQRLRTFDLSGQGDICFLALRPDGAGMAVATCDTIHAFGIETEDELDGFGSFHYYWPRALCYSADGRTLKALCSTSEDNVELVRLDAANGRVLTKQQLASGLTQPMGSLDPSGDKVAIVDNFTCSVFDLTGS